jgi:hypothetical protein
MGRTIARACAKAISSVTGRHRERSGVLAKGLVTTRCYRRPHPGAERELIWEDTSHNIVVNVGLNYLIQTGLANGTQIATWFAGLMYASPTVSATGTMASHAGWTECTVYSHGIGYGHDGVTCRLDGMHGLQRNGQAVVGRGVDCAGYAWQLGVEGRVHDQCGLYGWRRVPD